MERCPWSNYDELYQNYHDTVWGIPTYDEKQLFRMLCLEGMQAGLTWYQILKREAEYDNAFDNWDTAKIANYDDEKKAQLLLNPGIIRNRLKVNAIIENAKAFEMMKQNKENFVDYIWSFIGGQPVINYFQDISEVPAQTDISEAMSKSLKKKGFRFVGPTICYAFMQATGMVCDHLVTCPSHPDNIEEE
ncbi:MAG: DNA-3-methyladenine glycosylase I [Culicoidibacterales bacterium]